MAKQDEEKQPEEVVTPPPSDKPQAPVPVSDDALAMMEPILRGIPQVGDDVYENIMSTLLNAQTPAELDKPWRNESLSEWVDRRITVTGLRWAPSDYEGGWGFFLVVDFVDGETGEKMVGTTGSGSIVAQLGVAYSRGWMPLDCVIRQATRPTERGFYPLHVDIGWGRKR